MYFWARASLLVALHGESSWQGGGYADSFRKVLKKEVGTPPSPYLGPGLQATITPGTLAPRAPQRGPRVALTLCHSTQYYTANLIAVKSTGFTCVPFSTVVPLSFWQSITTGSETLHFNCRQISVSKSTIFPLLFDYFAMAYLHIFCSWICR